MKKNVLLLILVVSVSPCKGQKLKEQDVPVSVQNTFAQKFPKAKEVKWSKESASEFEAEFEIGALEQSAGFDPQGKWLVTETVIKKSALPQVVQGTIKKEFAGFKLEEAEKAESPDKGLFYEVELKKGKLKYEVQLSKEGNVIKKEKMK